VATPLYWIHPKAVCRDGKKKMLTTILTDSLKQWFDNKTYNRQNTLLLFTDWFNNKWHQLQNSISWLQLFNGCLVSEWQRLQNQHLRKNIIKERTTLTGQSWTTSLIVHLWNAFFEIWDQRNDLVQGKDKSTRDIAKCGKAISKIKHLYAPRQRKSSLPIDPSCS
jgi:hypothetical protein